MTEILIHLERGPDGQPVGYLRKGSALPVEFTGWLALIRMLEDELRDVSPGLSGGPAGTDPSSAG
jgi:hypothetical protein